MKPTRADRLRQRAKADALDLKGFDRLDDPPHGARQAVELLDHERIALAHIVGCDGALRAVAIRAFPKNTYDANGNLETVQGFAALNRTIVWDGLNRVSRVTKNGLTEMAYGPDDARFARTVTPPGGSAETTFFVRDMELSPAGVLTKYPLADAKRVGSLTYG
ncbi:hypothetical protein, partial [Acuticoccus kalidii]|uniref:hypothetical protein n=1 Tax=Acuticoccus kalidii TaxID=2910977 RepID=UPI0027152CFC